MGALDLERKERKEGKTGENHDTLTVFQVTAEVHPDTELVSIDIEGDGGGDCLAREAGSTRRSGSLMTPRTRSGSTGRSLVMRRRDGGGFPMDHAKDVVHTGRRVIERHADWLVWLVGVGRSG